MGQARPTFERRQLGLTLRRLREEAGKSQQVAADAFGKTRSRIVHLEEGLATVSPADLISLLDCYGVPEDERETVLALNEQARQRQKRRQHVDALPDAYRRFADLEVSATEINSFETGIVPGLLQCDSYARAVFAECAGIWWEQDTPEGQERLNYRRDRQARVFDSAAAKIFRFVITEDALRANLGSPAVMREQLAHILALLDSHRDLTVRVLPNSAFGNPLRGQGISIFCFGERGVPVGYQDTMLGPSYYYDDEDETTRTLRAFYRVWELALSKTESHELMVQITKEL